MDRLAKKCVIASGVLHGTLVLTLAFVPGFVNPETHPGVPGDASIPGDVTILPAPQLGEPAPKLPANAGQPSQQVPRTSGAAKQSTSQGPKPGISLDEVIRTPLQPGKLSGQGTAAPNAFATAIDTIRHRTSGQVEMGSFGGSSGATATILSCEEAVRSAYFSTWREPSDTTADEAVVKASVTIASDGTVLSTEITRPSGDAAMDRSVQRLLQEVTRISPFPSGSKETQRTYPLRFSLKAKRSPG